MRRTVLTPVDFRLNEHTRCGNNTLKYRIREGHCACGIKHTVVRVATAEDIEKIVITIP